LQHLDLETEFVATLLDPAWGPQAAEQVLVEDLDPSNPAFATAVSFSLRVPDRETVAIDRRIPGP
jgi:hypothetical protein